MITMGCFGGSRYGIVGGHAYSFIKTVKLSNGTRLVQVRNPWSVERYTGPWGDKSTKWTQKYKDEAGFDAKDDGLFFLPIEIFKSDFGITWINYDTARMWRSHWLILNDKTNSPGQSSWCGKSCVRHEFKLKSEVSQEIIVSANTWQDRGYPYKCKATATRGSKRHIINVEGGGTKAFNAGSIMLPPFNMSAGQEISIYIEMDYGNRTMSKDVSVVVWGDKGKVCLEHKAGIETASMVTI